MSELISVARARDLIYEDDDHGVYLLYRIILENKIHAPEIVSMVKPYLLNHMPEWLLDLDRPKENYGGFEYLRILRLIKVTSPTVIEFMRNICQTRMSSEDRCSLSDLGLLFLHAMPESYRRGRIYVTSRGEIAIDIFPYANSTGQFAWIWYNIESKTYVLRMHGLLSRGFETPKLIEEAFKGSEGFLGLPGYFDDVPREMVYA